MPWIVASNGSEYHSRVAITCDTSGATPGGAAVVARLTMSSPSVDFWAGVQADAFDVRFADAGGSIIAHERASWNYSGKSAVFDFEVSLPADAPTGSLRVVYLYFGAGTAVVADPTAGPFANTVSAWAEPARIFPAGRTIQWTSPASSESAASLTPAPVQTVVAIVDERRVFATEPLRGSTYGVGTLYNGSDSSEDLDWVFIDVVDDAAAALPTWASTLSLRAFTDSSGTTVRGIFTPDTNKDGLATLQIGWSGLLAIDKRVITVRAIAPAI